MLKACLFWAPYIGEEKRSSQPGEYSYLVWVGCAAKALKLLPIFKSHFGRKGEPLTGNFVEMWAYFGCVHSKFWLGHENIINPMFTDIYVENEPLFKDFVWKSDH